MSITVIQAYSTRIHRLVWLQAVTAEGKSTYRALPPR